MTDNATMSLRRTVLKLLLGSLGLAAAAGVFAALLPMSDVMVRASITGAVTAIGAGLLLFITALLDKPRNRYAGLALLGLIVAEHIGALALIWLDGMLGNRALESVALAMLGLVPCVLPAAVFLLAVASERGRLGGWAGVIACSVTAVCFLLAAGLENTAFDADRLWATGWSILSLGLLAAICMIPPLGGLLTWVRWFGVAFAGVALVALMDQIWNWRSSVIEEEWAAVLISLPIVFAHANGLRLVRLIGLQQWLRPLAIAAMVGTAVLSDLLILGDVHGDSMTGRFAIAGAIVTGCSTMAIIVMLAINRRVAAAPQAGELRDMSITCPRCAQKQAITVGRSACTACGLIIRIEVEEPRCAKCDFLLYGLRDGRCPECGTVVGG